MSRILPYNAKQWEVRAILYGRKTATRRLIKPQPKFRLCYTFAGCNHGTWSYPSDTVYEYWGEEYRLPDCITDEDKKMVWKPPYNADDILYVRGTWVKVNSVPVQYGYRADNNYLVPRWKPSIHMPKEAARIWLKVKDVRVERLQECGKGWCLDIEKEGVVTPQDPILYSSDDAYHKALREEFRELWDSTIKKSDIDRYGWDANPWVWVIEFERCEKPEEF